MTDLRQQVKLMQQYSKSLRDLSMQLEVISHGEVRLAGESLREVYVGAGANSFFISWDEKVTVASRGAEGILDLQHRVDKWIEILEESNHSECIRK